ncbi:3'-5' exonuclease [Vibrio panuliri]|uniref:DNA polymerase III subunit epsilon n=1 Tax=Vibrio panuliri TaxID=1381081 RepID=A0A1Q9HRI5_9VIBR|nr:3'-5' exonuclease [Vibrio panuliri]KAB1457076.1 3'-5' exonuclease [Vibrio panuliri]OLQ85192.1 DNA polymerase III subunit epsilon [Vibrio panuliri]OLQ93461.1 DNA polymerase III subunit epsilon [Vibrio panuliri]
MKRLLNYFHPCTQIRRAQERYLNQDTIPNEIRDLVSSTPVAATQLACESDFIVLDLETTGLDCEEDLILSMGWVLVRKGTIDLATSQHMYINSDSQVKPETAVINHITPQMLSEGVSIHHAMQSLFSAAQGNVFVAHGCMVEAQFINKYLERVMKVLPPPLLWIDTLKIEKKLQKAVNGQPDSDVRLSTTRERYRLPEYNNHNALVDAVSTAELLLAQQHRITPEGNTTIGTLYRLSV